MQAAAPGPMKAVAAPQAKEAVKTKKHAKRQARMEKRMEKFSKLIERKLAKRGISLEPGESQELDRNLRLAIIFAIIAVATNIVAFFIPFIWLISYLAWLAAVIFFVLWLVSYLE